MYKTVLFRIATIILACSSISGWAQAPALGTYQNPVIAGDHPDPSVIRVGEDYWATSTSGPWEPEFPLLHSRDLVNWKQVGAVFAKRPEWSKSDFWAPEISEYKGRYYVIYTARKRKGPLCVAVASAPKPQGPYEDHGPLVCQKDGSIDGFPAVDENGQRYLIWKEDGNSRERPTPIWAQRMSEDGMTLTGKPTELIRNDKAWESKVVEGPFVLRRAGYFYMFYSGAGCCGLRCDYAVGVARAKQLLGPWEKNPANPIVRSSAKWQCPGHGSLVSDAQGSEFFLFHAYQNGAFQLGRQAVLERVNWGDDGWPYLNDGAEVSARSAAPSPGVRQDVKDFSDDFSDETLAVGWEWPAGEAPRAQTRAENGKGLWLWPSGIKQGGIRAGILTRRASATNYVAQTVVKTKRLARGGYAGLAAYGSDREAVGVAISATSAVLWERQNARNKVLGSMKIKTPSVYLRVRAEGVNRLRFQVSEDGREWKSFTPRGEDEISVARWDGSVRLALFTAGAAENGAQFDNFSVSVGR